VRTLSGWYQKRRIPGNDEWFPLENGHANRRIFNEQIEAALFDHIRHNFIQPGIGATVHDLQTLALNAFSSLEPGDMRADPFSASTRWAQGFQKRWGLSIRKPHHERRTEVSQDIVEAFLSRLATLAQDYPQERVFNMDETAWLTWSGFIMRRRGVSHAHWCLTSILRTEQQESCNGPKNWTSSYFLYRPVQLDASSLSIAGYSAN
jgi:hypothetical protein